MNNTIKYDLKSYLEAVKEAIFFKIFLNDILTLEFTTDTNPHCV